jgi:hypothetical protein
MFCCFVRAVRNLGYLQSYNRVRDRLRSTDDETAPDAVDADDGQARKRDARWEAIEAVGQRIARGTRPT